MMARMGADSRAARLCCVISGRAKRCFTASLYLGAGVKRSRLRSGGACGLRGGVWAAAWLV
ncbi:MAG: hypothetical protein ACLUI3_14070 [Christensenellales bacterium]